MIFGVVYDISVRIKVVEYGYKVLRIRVRVSASSPVLSIVSGSSGGSRMASSIMVVIDICVTSRV